ncbi:hypothetical protein FE257_011023 [Aspergillus nanangensis]|uniref:Uncharacterized protein n=1 Tax=Aspergillus nanangensis TaxID=2582783 RepID=A0AAD4GRT9_ASPNN|nr:hypothetical protein FE257_011023 [Aspergillus nanangensis]
MSPPQSHILTGPLKNLPTLSSREKSILVRSIANEITAAFVDISRHIAQGTLSDEHATPMNEIIRTIMGTDARQRERLERKVYRYRRRAQRWKTEKAWIQRQFGALVRRSETVQGRWRERFGRLKKDVGRTKTAAESCRRSQSNNSSSAREEKE